MANGEQSFPNPFAAAGSGVAADAATATRNFGEALAMVEQMDMSAQRREQLAVFRDQAAERKDALNQAVEGTRKEYTTQYTTQFATAVGTGGGQYFDVAAVIDIGGEVLSRYTPQKEDTTVVRDWKNLMLERVPGLRNFVASVQSALNSPMTTRTEVYGDSAKLPPNSNKKPNLSAKELERAAVAGNDSAAARYIIEASMPGSAAAWSGRTGWQHITDGVNEPVTIKEGTPEYESWTLNRKKQDALMAQNGWTRTQAQGAIVEQGRIQLEQQQELRSIMDTEKVGPTQAQAILAGRAQNAADIQQDARARNVANKMIIQLHPEMDAVSRAAEVNLFLASENPDRYPLKDAIEKNKKLIDDLGTPQQKEEQARRNQIAEIDLQLNNFRAETENADAPTKRAIQQSAMRATLIGNEVDKLRRAGSFEERHRGDVLAAIAGGLGDARYKNEWQTLLKGQQPQTSAAVRDPNVGITREEVIESRAIARDTSQLAAAIRVGEKASTPASVERASEVIQRISQKYGIESAMFVPYTEIGRQIADLVADQDKLKAESEAVRGNPLYRIPGDAVKSRADTSMVIAAQKEALAQRRFNVDVGKWAVGLLSDKGKVIPEELIPGLEQAAGAVFGGAQETIPTFATEEAARSAGVKSGEFIRMINPETGQLGTAQLR